MKTPSLLVLVGAAGLLGACDMAADVAGDAIGAQVREQFMERCQQIAENAGVSAELVEPACSCGADRFAEEVEAGDVQINRERIEEVVRSCALELTAPDSEAPAEDPNV